jgi:hypothetical protein
MTFIRVVPINRPVRPAFNSKREYSQAERDAEARYIAEQNQLRAEFLQQWSSPMPVPDDPEAAGYFEAVNTEGAAFECWLLRRAGYVVAATPVQWINQIEEFWLTNNGGGVFDKQSTAASITLPFLMQGGEFSITYESYKEHGDRNFGGGEIETHIIDKKRLHVSSEHGIHVGILNKYIGEMSATLVVLPRGTPQDVADRIAVAYGRIITLNLPEDYPVVMPLRKNCAVCGRAFTDMVSRVIGIGPTCSAHLGVPYSASYATRIVAARQAFLCEASAIGRK